MPQCVFVSTLFQNMGLVQKCFRKFQCHFLRKPLPTKQSTQYMANETMVINDLKDKVWNKSHTLNELRNNTRCEVSAVSGKELQSANNVFRRYAQFTESSQHALQRLWVFIRLSKSCYHWDAFCTSLHWHSPFLKGGIRRNAGVVSSSCCRKWPNVYFLFDKLV